MATNVRATDWQPGDTVLSPAGFKRSFGKWMDRYKLSTRKEANRIEAEVGRDVTKWCQLKAMWIRIDKRNDAIHRTTVEQWTDENNSTFQQVAERLGVSEFTPPGPPRQADFSHDVMNQGESRLRRKPLPSTPRTARVAALRSREKRQAVSPWIVVIGPEEIGHLKVDARIIDMIGTDPVVEVLWNRRSAFEDVVSEKAQSQRFLIRLIGGKVPGGVGASCKVSESVLIGQSRPQMIQGKKVQVLDALPIDIEEALREISEPQMADELNEPLPRLPSA